VVRALSRVSAPRAIAHVAGAWLAIAGAIALCQRFFHPLLYVVTVMWIGARLALPGYARDAHVTRGDLKCSGNAPS